MRYMERRKLLQRLADSANISEEVITIQPLLEVCGFHRVLIEQQRGVIEYGPDKITVRVKGGTYSIRGSKLSLCRMCDRQLLVRGNVDSIVLQRGK
jgi:sporulation protein YqfC